MTSTTTFDLNAAKQTASQQQNDDLVLAAGGAGIALDSIVMKLAMSDDLTPAQKVTALQAIAVNAAGIVNAAMSGGQGPTTLGSGTSAGRSGDQDRDLQNKLDAAETRNDELEKQIKAARKGFLAIDGMTLPNGDDKIPDDIEAKVKTTVKAVKDGAKLPAGDLVAKADVRAAADKIHSGWSTKRKSRMSSDQTVIELPQKASDIDEGLADLGNLLS